MGRSGRSGRCTHLEGEEEFGEVGVTGEEYSPEGAAGCGCFEA